MPKKGEKYECSSCGVEVVCRKGCQCEVSHLVCCGRPMENKKEGK